MFLGNSKLAEYVLNMFLIWFHCVSFVICHLSVLKTHLSLTHPVAQLMFFLRGVGIKIESGCLQKGCLILKRGLLPHSALWTTMVTKCIIEWCLPKYHYIKIWKDWRYFCGYRVYVAEWISKIKRMGQVSKVIDELYLRTNFIFGLI